jgi:prefoldin subunit 5
MVLKFKTDLDDSIELEIETNTAGKVKVSIRAQYFADVSKEEAIAALEGMLAELKKH